MITRSRRSWQNSIMAVMTGLLVVAGVALTASCRDNDKKADTSADSYRGERTANKTPAPSSPATGMPMDELKEEEADDDMGFGGGGFATEGKIGKSKPKADKKVRARAGRKGAGKDSAPGRGDDGESGGERGPQTRSWFPETFLFEPLILTDESGAASVDVRVPDRLTTWRVLALAHSRQGGQAGTTASFLGTLPAYVDPVLPSLLRSGDRVRLPIQLVNTTPTPLPSTLSIEAANATVSGADGALTIPPQSNVVRYATFGTDTPGEARLLARLGDTDVVIRTTDVVPTGRPVIHTQSGTLAAPCFCRSIEIRVIA